MRATASLRAASLSGPAAGLRGRAPALARSALAAAAPLTRSSRLSACAGVRCAATAGNAGAGAGSGGGSDSVGSAPDKLGPAAIAPAAVAQAIAKAQLDALLASRAEGESLRRQLGEQQRLCAELQALVGEQRRLSGEQLAERLGALAEQMGGVAEKLQGHESRVSELLAEWGARAGLERDLQTQLQASEAQVSSLRQQLGEQQAAMAGELDRARAQITEAQAARDAQAAAELGQAQAQAQVVELQRELESLRKAGPTKPTAAWCAASAPPAPAAATAPTVWADRSALAAFEAATQAAAKGAADAVVELLLRNIHTQELLDPESYFVVMEQVPPSEPGSNTLAAATPSLAVWLLADDRRRRDDVAPQLVEAVPGGVLKHSGAEQASTARARRDNKHPPAAVSPRLAKHARAAVLGALVPLLGEGMGAEWLTDCKLVNRCTWQDPFPWALDPAVAASMPVLKVTSPPSPWAAAEAARQAEAQNVAKVAAQLAAQRLHSTDTSYLVIGPEISRFIQVQRLEGRLGDGLAFKSYSWSLGKDYGRLLDSSRAALLGAVQAILGDGATAQWLTGCQLHRSELHGVITDVPVMAVTHTNTPDPQVGSWGAGVQACRQSSLRSAAGTVLNLLARHLFTADEAYLVFEDRDWDLEDRYAEPGLRVFLLSGIDASSVASGGLQSVGATPSDKCNWFPSSESLRVLERSQGALLQELRPLLGEVMAADWVTLDLDIDWSRNKFDRYDYVPDEKRVTRFACRGVPALRVRRV